jgi:hypothetical protein
MFNLSLRRDQKVIIKLAELAQRLVFELHTQEPDNQTFEQQGILNGLPIITDFILEDEIGLAIEHLLYMVYESGISFPSENIQELHNLTSKYKVKNFYVS